MLNDHYDSYDDWYDNGPGSVNFNRSCRESERNFFKNHDIIVKRKEPKMKLKNTVNRKKKTYTITDTKGYSFCFVDKDGEEVVVEVREGNLIMSISDTLDADGNVISRRYYNGYKKQFAGEGSNAAKKPCAVESIEVR